MDQKTEPTGQPCAACLGGGCHMCGHIAHGDPTGGGPNHRLVNSGDAGVPFTPSSLGMPPVGLYGADPQDHSGGMVHATDYAGQPTHAGQVVPGQPLTPGPPLPPGEPGVPARPDVPVLDVPPHPGQVVPGEPLTPGQPL